jgi:hypothetical protein
MQIKGSKYAIFGTHQAFTYRYMLECKVQSLHQGYVSVTALLLAMFSE